MLSKYAVSAFVVLIAVAFLSFLATIISLLLLRPILFLVFLGLSILFGVTSVIVFIIVILLGFIESK